MVNDNNIFIIFISECVQGVVFIFLIDQCCSNFEGFLSGFKRSRFCDVIQCRRILDFKWKIRDSKACKSSFWFNYMKRLHRFEGFGHWFSFHFISFHLTEFLLLLPSCCLFLTWYYSLYRTWQEGKVIIIDDSIEHEVWQNGTSFRMILIVDFWHPDLTPQQKAVMQPI